MKILLMRLAVTILKAIYIPFKPLRLKNKITILSRQSDRMSVDIRLLKGALDEKGIKNAVLTKRLNKTLKGGIGYGFHMLRQMYHISTSKTVVMDGYCILFSILPKKKGQRGVQIWHALGAIKKFGYSSIGKPDGNDGRTAEIMKMYRNYDYVIAPSETTAAIFGEAFGISQEKIRLFGLPRIDYLLARDEEAEEKVKTRYPRLGEKETVLYLPTFRRSGQPDITGFVAHFPYDRYDLVLKKHWLDKSDYSWAAEYGVTVADNINTMDMMKSAGKVITDYSAAAFEAAILDKGLYFYIQDREEYDRNIGLNMDFDDEEISIYVYEDAKRLWDSIGEEYDHGRLAAFRDKYISVDTDNCTERLAEFLRELTSG